MCSLDFLVKDSGFESKCEHICSVGPYISLLAYDRFDDLSCQFQFLMVSLCFRIYTKTV